MDTAELLTAAPVPGPMSQEQQGAAPMDLDGGNGSPLTPEEQALWYRSEIARAEELGKELADQRTASQGPAAASAAEHGKGAPGKGRPTKEEKAARRALRSPYRKKEEEEGTSTLEAVQEEAGERKIPSDEEDEDDEAAEADPPEPADGSPQVKED